LWHYTICSVVQFSSHFRTCSTQYLANQ
jgi:hypothetical protein